MSGPAAVLLALLGSGRIVSVQGQQLGPRAAVRVEAVGELGPVAAQREGGELVISVAGSADEALAPPAVSLPLEGVRLERSEAGVTLRVRVPAEVPYEVLRDASGLTVVFGQAPAAAAPAGGGDVRELYRRILPPPSSADAAAGPAEEPPAAPADPPAHGLAVGSLSLSPAVTLSYVSADVLITSPAPRRAHYAELRPALRAELPVGSARGRAEYSARLRRGSSVPGLGSTSHFLDASIELPVGSMLLRGADHFARGVLETREVDPGGEYFFGLGRFRRNEASVSARLPAAGGFALDAGASLDDVRVDDESTFFDHQRRTLSAGFEHDLAGRGRWGLRYVYERIPPPAERPLVEADTHQLGLTVSGEVTPLLTADVFVGYRQHRSPAAGPRGQRYQGLAGSLRLTKEFTRASRLQLLASRATPVSAFEDDPFYVSSSTAAELHLALPFELSGRAAYGLHRNRYRTAASGLGAPREDRMSGWSLGLGRPLGQWGFARVDYAEDRRDSNLDVLDVRTHAFSVQLGVGAFGAAERRP